MKILILTIFTSFVTSLWAVTIAIPEPSEMIRKSGIVSSGFFSEKSGTVFFTPTANLKGMLVLGRAYEVRYPKIGEPLPDTILSKIAGVNEVIFLSNLSDPPQPSRLDAIFGLCSIWPRGTTPALLPQRTLNECVEFTKSTVAASDIATAMVHRLVMLAHSKDEAAIIEINKLIAATSGPKVSHIATAATVTQLLREIDPEKLKFTELPPTTAKDILRIRITEPVKLDLEFQKIKSTDSIKFMLKSIGP